METFLNEKNGKHAFKVNNQRNRVDRFVLPRDYIHGMQLRSCHADFDSADEDVDNTNVKDLKQKKYATYLEKTFGMNKLQTMPLYKSHKQQWPCVPRRRSYLSSTPSIMDLPNYRFATFPDLLDWSKDNNMVAALGSQYYIWSCNSQSIVYRGNARKKILSCKFDPRGDLLLLGMRMHQVEIHNNIRHNIVNVVNCHGFSTNVAIFHGCSVTAVDWSPTGNSFAMGCSYGSVTACSRDAKVLHYGHRIFDSAIYLLRVSPNTRYIAVTALSSHTVLLLQWPTLERFSNLHCDWITKTLDWHPWRTSLLGVGAITRDLRGHISIWNAPTAEVKTTTLAPEPYSLDAMLFSQRTGELVVSLWNSAVALHPNVYSKLVVLSGPDTIVDQWGEGRNLDRVRTMVFNPDGTKLATATLDEDLIIWDFLPGNKNEAKRGGKRRRFSAIPEYLDETIRGHSFR